MGLPLKSGYLVIALITDVVGLIVLYSLLGMTREVEEEAELEVEDSL